MKNFMCKYLLFVSLSCCFIDQLNGMNSPAGDLGQKLLCAILHGNQINQVCDLINHGANLETTDFLGETPLLKAARFGNQEYIQTLLEARANVNVQGDSNAPAFTGYTALMLVTDAGNNEICEKLIDNGADLTLRNVDGCTALMLAAQCKNSNILPLFINAHNKLILCREMLYDAWGIAPIEICNMVLAFEGIEDLNILINATNKVGQTALIHAINMARFDTSQRGNLKHIVSMLLKTGAHVTIEDVHGHNARYYAEQLPSEYPEKNDLIELLLAAEAQESAS
ncbi:MAG: ankyrin repeat domain-containing protein [Candidatus Babeliales bacterium]|jgi:ankyrin repeat protein